MEADNDQQLLISKGEMEGHITTDEPHQTVSSTITYKKTGMKEHVK